MKKNDSRALARIKRMYREFKDNLFIKDGKRWRPCESITEFLELKWVKKLKNTGSIERHPLDKLDAKQKNRRERYSGRKQIKEGIEEYNDKDTEYFCPNCVFYDGGFCTEQGAYVVDEAICQEFRD